MSGATQLPVIELGGKQFFVDMRLGQIRNVNDPHDFRDMSKETLALFVRASKRKAGDQVRLMGLDPSITSLGTLNIHFLSEEGVTYNTLVPILEIVSTGRYIVKLPSGYKLEVREGDIIE
jgi:siroheme synthase